MGAKIGILGAGAVGCYIGGKLAAVGSDVVFVGRERIKREIETHGLSLTDLDGTTAAVPAERFVFDTDPAPLADCAAVLCCVKSGGTAEAAKRLAEVLRPSTLIVSFQNGVRNADEIRAHAPHAVLAGIVNFNILSKGQGAFRCATSGALIMEASTQTVATELDTALRGAGFELERSRNIRGLQWSKLLVNLNNSIVALSDRSIRDVILTPGYRRVLATLIGEGLDVLGAAGIKPEVLGVVPMNVLVAALRLPTPLVRMVARAQLKIDPEARSSMWDDLTAGRATEVDWINGEVVRLAESCGAQAPHNRRMVEIVHDAERAAKGSPRLSADELWRRLAS